MWLPSILDHLGEQLGKECPRYLKMMITMILMKYSTLSFFQDFPRRASKYMAIKPFSPSKPILILILIIDDELVVE